MTSLAIVPGAAVWLGIAGCTVAWIVLIALTPGTFLGPRKLLRRLLESWLSRCVILAIWAEAGWHIFCQRP